MQQTRPEFELSTAIVLHDDNRYAKRMRPLHSFASTTNGNFHNIAFPKTSV